MAQRSPARSPRRKRSRASPPCQRRTACMALREGRRAASRQSLTRDDAVAVAARNNPRQRGGPIRRAPMGNLRLVAVAIRVESAPRIGRTEQIRKPADAREGVAHALFLRATAPPHRKCGGTHSRRTGPRDAGSPPARRSGDGRRISSTRPKAYVLEPASRCARGAGRPCAAPGTNTGTPSGAHHARRPPPCSP